MKTKLLSLLALGVVGAGIFASAPAEANPIFRKNINNQCVTNNNQCGKKHHFKRFHHIRRWRR